jgi:protocatechuate 3,4-dioxygenase beta subunit
MISLTRRDLLRLLSGSALAWAGSRRGFAQSPTMPIANGRILTPELTEGPFYIDLERIRRDITEGKPGLPLRLKVRVVQLATGAPLADAAVDVWHCDAQGIYSGFSSHHPPGGGPGPGGGPPPDMVDDDDFMPPPGGPPGSGPGHPHKPDNSLTFLRGVQITDADGMAEIQTIYPGWYQGRAPHLHLRVHLGGRIADGRYQGGHISHTGQLFFPEEISTRVYQLSAYTKKETGRRALAEDDIFRQGGSQVTPVTLADPRRFEAGFSSEPLLIVDPSSTPPQV